MQAGGGGDAGLAYAAFAAEEKDAHAFIVTGGGDRFLKKLTACCLNASLQV